LNIFLSSYKTLATQSCFRLWKKHLRLIDFETLGSSLYTLSNLLNRLKLLVWSPFLLFLRFLIKFVEQNIRFCFWATVNIYFILVLLLIVLLLHKILKFIYYCFLLVFLETDYLAEAFSVTYISQVWFLDNLNLLGYYIHIWKDNNLRLLVGIWKSFVYLFCLL
jgi:hypothetical protein